MTRTLSGGITTMLASNTHRRCSMLRLDLADGSVLAFTSHNRDLEFDLGDGAVTYSARVGIIPSNLALSVGFDADDIEIEGPITADGLTTLPAFLGGRFDNAKARLFQINWSNLGDGAIKLLRGYVALVEVEGSKFKLTIQSEVTKFNQTIGRTITAYCDADFGDARCTKDPVEVTGTVTGVTDKMGFTVSFAGDYADDFFDRGTVQFLTGELAGTRKVEIFDWTAAGVISLWASLAGMPEIGDTLTIRQGCGKTRPDCMAFDNMINFRGFPDVPGSDQVLRYPNPGS